jgi:hypothetical protein
MGNTHVHPDLPPQISSRSEFELPAFTIDRSIGELRIGINKDGSGIKYYKDDIYYYSKLVNTKKEKNYIEFIFQDDSSLIIFSKEETCSEKEKTKCDLQFMFKSKILNTNGVINPRYKTMSLGNSPFDEIDKMQ